MTVQELIERCKISDAGDGMVKIACDRKLANKHLPEIKAKKPEILAYLAEEKAAEEAERKARKAKIDAIEGLNEIKAALEAERAYRRAFDRMMEDEHNDGVNPPKRPVANSDDLKARYPRAAAYIKAETWEMTSHYAKSGAGRRAKERIIDGDDPVLVLAKMEAEWSNYCKEDMWNM